MLNLTLPPDLLASATAEVNALGLREEPRRIGRRHHYRALEISWRETRDLTARLLALTGHRRLIALWTLATGKALQYEEMAFNQIGFSEAP